ncbi:olfactory receptor 8U9 [Pogona vitticeps]
MGAALSNCTRVPDFILSGITDRTELKFPLFTVFLAVYIITMAGNLGIIFLKTIDARLHTPMYFFLSNLAFVDTSYSSAITPKILADLLAERKSIGCSGCVTQLFLCCICGTSECLLLALMAYDRYEAICNPLHYSTIMSGKVCVCLVTGCYIMGIFCSVVLTVCVFTSSFCGPNVINHFYCDIPPLLQISCSRSHISEIVIFAQVGILCISTTMIVLISYICILSTILKICFSERRQKAFSTCSSHLMVVCLFYGTVFYMYLQPSSSHSLGQDKIASLFYSVMIPMLNPLIYSYRNKEVKDAFWRVLRKTV